MTQPLLWALSGISGLVGILVIAAGPSAHPDTPPPGHTGGFGEPTCRVCHAEYPLDSALGTLLLTVPETAEPGSIHTVRVLLEAEGTVAAGFQLSARTPDGRQAGTLRATDGRVRVILGDTPAGQVQFAHQTDAGVGSEERSATAWTVEWTAPLSSTRVEWSLASNSGNGDNSPFGDLVWTARGSTQVGSVH